jgi:hypothetical protein
MTRHGGQCAPLERPFEAARCVASTPSQSGRTACDKSPHHTAAIPYGG